MVVLKNFFLPLAKNSLAPCVVRSNLIDIDFFVYTCKLNIVKLIVSASKYTYCDLDNHDSQ